MSHARTATACGLAVALIWGLSFLSIKVAVATVPPMTMAVARFAIACAVLPLVAHLAGESLRVAPRELPLLAAGGLTGITIYFLGENHGVALLSASEASLVIGTIPVLTVLSEWLFLGQKVSARVGAGAAASFLGVALIVAPALGTPSSRLGYLCMALAAFSWVAYAFLTRGVAARCGKLALTFWQSLFGLLGCVPFALGEAAAWRQPGTAAVLNILYLGVVCSAAGYWLYALALERLGAGRTSVFVNLIPVVSVLASFLLLGERLGALQLLGGAVAVAGVYLATVSGTRTRRQEAPPTIRTRDC